MAATIETALRFGLALRGYTPTVATLALVDIGGGSDASAPQLYSLFQDNRTPIFNAAMPTALAPKVYCRLSNIKITVPMAPTKFPTKTIPQFRRSARPFTLPFAHAMTRGVQSVRHMALRGRPESS